MKCQMCPVSAKEVMRQNTAMSESTMISSLTQDLIRRMKHTNVDLPMNEKIDNINEFSKKVLSSGYSREQTLSIVKAALV